MLSNTCKYGLRAMVYIAGNSQDGKKIGIKQISSDLDLPMPFLAKILQSLAKQKLLLSSKGPNGGFSISRNPKDIYLLEVVKAIDGQDVFSKCVLHNDNCRSVDENKVACALHGDYVKQRRKIEKLFQSKTIYSLVSTAKNSEDILI
ncbi:MAG: Rrf2 family transcriptional regulator [Marinilabiliaceae bacterium]|jgi:Rrf2 family protein|nr:Rrf2 family transcriptional regulator [Marinilabiliaceae bacterium]